MLQCSMDNMNLLRSQDEIRVIEKPDHGLTIRDVFRIYHYDRDEVGRLLAIPQMSESWKKWAEHLLQQTEAPSADTAEPGCC